MTLRSNKKKEKRPQPGVEVVSVKLITSGAHVFDPDEVVVVGEVVGANSRVRAMLLNKCIKKCKSVGGTVLCTCDGCACRN